MTETLREGLIKKLGEENFGKVQSVKVGIAGAGGLGSNLAANLVRCGFKKLKIFDFDKVSASNLDRQFYFSDQVGKEKVFALRDNLLRIEPTLEIEPFARKIEKDNARWNFRDCAIVAECFDRAEDKTMLVSELLPMGKFIVSASGLGGAGSSDDIRVHTMKENLVVVGDLKSDIEHAPALSPRVNITAAKQADVILAHIIKL